MDIRRLKKDIVEIQEILHPPQYVVKKNNSNYIMTGHESTLRALESLYNYAVFSDDIEKLKKVSSFYNFAKIIHISNADLSLARQHIATLNQKCVMLSSILNDIIEDDDDNVIRVIVDRKMEFDDLRSLTTDIEKTLGQLLGNTEIDGEMHLDKISEGSLILTISLAASAVTIVGSAVWAAAVIRKKMLEGNMMKEHIRSFKTANDANEILLKALDAEVELLCSNEAQYIIDEYKLDTGDSEKANADYKIRLMHSIKEINKMINDGVRIESSVTAPEKVSNLFPDNKGLDTVVSKIKELSE